MCSSILKPRDWLSVCVGDRSEEAVEAVCSAAVRGHLGLLRDSGKPFLQ